jgi:hypothetical protein
MRLDKRKFVAWLEAKPPDEIVGDNRDCHACPIAKFYCETSGGCEVVISQSSNGYVIDRGDGDRALPQWAVDFVFEVDGDNDGHISAGRALEILASSR